MIAKRKGQVVLEFKSVLAVLAAGALGILVAIYPLIDQAAQLANRSNVLVVGLKTANFVNKFAYTYGTTALFISLENYLERNFLLTSDSSAEGNLLTINLMENSTGKKVLKTPLTFGLLVDVTSEMRLGMLDIRIIYQDYLLWKHLRPVPPSSGGVYDDIKDKWW